MVKTFKRPAAGDGEQLPSDLRTAECLQRTTAHLLGEELLGNLDDLPQVQPYIWDRTRAVRNDFSIQQFKDPANVRISMDCHEKIARFHLVSAHQMTHADLFNAD